MTALVLVGGCLPFGSAGRPSVATAHRPDPKRAFGSGEVTGVVVDSLTGAPIPNVVLFATTDTSVGAPVTPWRAATDAEGRFLLTDVPAGWRVVEARAIGYARHRRTMLVRRGATDTVWIMMRTGSALLAEQREELALPTEVTPCRPADVSSAWLSNALAEAVAADGELTPKVRAEAVRLVVKPAQCRRAIGAWQERVGKTLHAPQVYLFDLGDLGYALYDPVESLGNSVVVVPILDRAFRLRKVLAL
ncbi:MAG: carboxypeptidase-like regulatory domain-containing protein [Gemmatimonadaceae bacterium]|nr:carboxypeptidase-like regulatory domain-containing protein [Gemmatimonadaceae bacterium]